MKKTYKAPKTLVADLSSEEILNNQSELGISTQSVNGRSALSKGRDDDFDDEDLW